MAVQGKIISARTKLSANAVSQHERLPFRLQEGEEIYAVVKPDKSGFILSRSFGSLNLIVVILFFLLFIYLTASPGGVGKPIRLTLNLLIDLLVAFVMAVFISLIPSLISYGKFTYWITNHRVVQRRGIIGFSIESLPLENVADVVLKRSMMDMVFDLSSLMVVPISGRAYALPTGSETDDDTSPGGISHMPAMKPSVAIDMQELIFELRNLRMGARIVEKGSAAQ
jgi:membrane protein YdbS with pleckstrin-like domain